MFIDSSSSEMKLDWIVELTGATGGCGGPAGAGVICIDGDDGDCFKRICCCCCFVDLLRKKFTIGFL